ncbi:RrF2 family transcriptional regulator [Maridesulfovibrio salexigens]|uniref:Transcriptional regulator, BadM/Rrf2 family n=1 Tax=Maridesulfovibrio salexigens (strain ATCC 14822 / DSM 2638 / NCIMB 8403 / VKM B-1763) TaxID=526222 RepID=C6BWH4_MARSD|nr:Rrf2 family transcriptional regulator [Maridesulfovibrio salexigens]ACS78418.1 transcriptional regulator, BadM/Rrf2 family [Maridesulfovibrio salexigens DSM 2638]
MKLSARARYATRLLLDLALRQSDTPRKTTLLSESTGITVQFIEQILRPLKKAGLIVSVRGATGGHILDKDPSTISIGEIVRIMEGGINLTDCVADESICARSATCKTRKVWVRSSKVLEEELDSISIADLMDNPDSFSLDD